MNNAPETIYLIPGEDGHVWCDDHAPDEYCDPADAVRYVRADALGQAQARVAELERDAARYQYIRANQYWTRSEGNDIDPGFSCVGTKFDYSDDFSARIMLDHHIDRRLRQQADEAERAGGEK